jgi:hypothetical protein
MVIRVFSHHEANLSDHIVSVADIVLPFPIVILTALLGFRNCNLLPKRNVLAYSWIAVLPLHAGVLHLAIRLIREWQVLIIKHILFLSDPREPEAIRIRVAHWDSIR